MDEDAGGELLREQVGGDSVKGDGWLVERVGGCQQTGLPHCKDVMVFPGSVDCSNQPDGALQSLLKATQAASYQCEHTYCHAESPLYEGERVCREGSADVLISIWFSKQQGHTRAASSFLRPARLPPDGAVFGAEKQPQKPLDGLPFCFRALRFRWAATSAVAVLRLCTEPTIAHQVLELRRLIGTAFRKIMEATLTSFW